MNSLTPKQGNSVIISEDKKLRKGYLQDVDKHGASYESNAEGKSANERGFFYQSNTLPIALIAVISGLTCK